MPALFGIAQIFSSAALQKDLPAIKKILESENLVFDCIREVPTNKSVLGEIALKSLPKINQVFITPISKDFNKERFESCLLQARKKIEELYSNDERLYICSMSSQTIVYKGLMLPDAISKFYTDIAKKSSGDHLFYANNTEVKYIDCTNIKLPYFSNLISDVLNRTGTATSQKITFLSMELALQAQIIAENDQ